MTLQRDGSQKFYSMYRGWKIVVVLRENILSLWDVLIECHSHPANPQETLEIISAEKEVSGGLNRASFFAIEAGKLMIDARLDSQQISVEKFLIF